MEKVKKKPFKGNVVSIADVKESVPVQFQNSSRRNSLGIPEFFVVDKVDATYRGQILVYYYDKDAMNRPYVYLKDTDMVKILTGAKGREVIKTLEDSRETATPAYRYGTLSGADPEIFVYDENGKVVPSWLFLKSKEEAMKEAPVSFGRAYWDGFQAEFDVQPGGCHGYFFDSVQRGLRNVHSQAKLFNKNAKLSNISVVKIEKKVLESASEQHVQFGCMPSLNVYGLKGFQGDGRSTEYRFAGGHIHIGIDNGVIENDRVIRIVKALDAILGVVCVSLFAEFDFPIRRRFYGMAGEYRRPKHGIEYRVLSNGWLMHPVVANMVFDLSRIAMTYGYYGFKSWKVKEDKVIDIIQDCDVDGARSVLRDNKDVFLKLVSAAYQTSPEVAAGLYADGIEKFIENPSDIEGNWKLNGLWIPHCENRNSNWWRASVDIRAGKKV